MAESKYIEIKGAREHNLKNVNISIPKNQLTVITGLSGSGKSSLIGCAMPESGGIEVKTSTIGARRRRVGTGTDGVKVKAGQRGAKKRRPEEKISPVMARILDHRERLRARFVADMGKTMSDWEMTKLLCSYALPPGKYQEKYKEAAEILLRRYKNLVTILAAPPASLVKNDGIGESIVILICIVHACCLKMEWENLE